MHFHKREWDIQFANLLRNAKLYRTPLSLLMMRMEEEDVAKVLRIVDGCIRPEDALCQWGKYLALILHITKKEAMSVALRIKKVLEEQNVKVRMAVASYPQDASQKNQMLRIAENLLWESLYDESFTIKVAGG
jgi:hypothetical protein